MVANLVIILIILSIYYVYTNHNREFTATASAIQQIWSGTCRLSCRQSRYSGYSGLSGIVSGRNTESSYLSSVRTGSTAVCVCDSCPCELVENVLRTCSPATNVYTRTIEFVSDCYYDLVKTLCDFFNYIDQVMRCGVTCQRQPQMLPVSRLNSIGHISFGSTKEEDEKERPIKNILKPTTFTFPKKPELDDFEYKATSSRTSESTAISLDIDTKISAKSPAGSEQLSNSCSKCIETGKTCIGSCPRQKKK
ncbi:uncharacterized protein LOC126773033 [Nymphalis io]|uniref:uncharacterized protein LOC126773033 n=1 Tax=Inachis io TaxID=171585 RepID=UPI002169F92E|nr:uncharacterized protein LOC126773033 [Nymphalis io]